MSKFLDKKEQVLSVELTQYGKYLLSIGKLDPVYYQFFDGDVLYDAQYAGITTETQNEISTRIRETPQLETQYLFHGIETEVLKLNELIRKGEEKLGSVNVQPTREKHYSLTGPVGTISLDATTAPAWQLKVEEGEISGSVMFATSSFATLEIPQIRMKDLEYKTIAKMLPADEVQSMLRSDLGLLIDNFKDGSYVDVIEDQIIINLKELNALDGNDNFEIEVFEIQSFGTKEIYIPLYFASNEVQHIKNNILLDEEQIETDLPLIDSTSVENYFEVLVDNEIEDELIKKDFERDLYKSSVRDVEKCD